MYQKTHSGKTSTYRHRPLHTNQHNISSNAAGKLTLFVNSRKTAESFHTVNLKDMLPTRKPLLEKYRSNDKSI
jgi:hypothetical protein